MTSSSQASTLENLRRIRNLVTPGCLRVDGSELKCLRQIVRCLLREAITCLLEEPKKAATGSRLLERFFNLPKIDPYRLSEVSIEYRGSLSQL